MLSYQPKHEKSEILVLFLSLPNTLGWLQTGCLHTSKLCKLVVCILAYP